MVEGRRIWAIGDGGRAVVQLSVIHAISFLYSSQWNGGNPHDIGISVVSSAIATSF